MKKKITSRSVTTSPFVRSEHVARLTPGACAPANEFQTDSVWRRLIYSPLSIDMAPLSINLSNPPLYLIEQQRGS